MFFDFEALDTLEAPFEDEPAYAGFDFDELEAVEASVGKRSDKATQQPVKTADPETDMKIQQALADAVRRRRKAAGLAEENVADSDLTMKIQQAVEDARLRKENSKPKELSNYELTVQKALAGARERQHVPASSTWHNSGYDGATCRGNSSKAYGSWWPWPLKSGTTYVANEVQEGDGWDVPIQVGAVHMAKEARINLRKACIDAKVLDYQVQKVLDEAKLRQPQKYFASTEPSVPHTTVEQIHKAQMIAESRSYVANELLQARRMAPYKPKTDDKDELKRTKQDEEATVEEESNVPRAHNAASAKMAHRNARVWRPVQEIAVPETASQAKHDRWADQSDSDAEAEGASPRQRGGG